MHIIEGSGALPQKLRRGVLTVGNFDGLHIGHRRILQTVVERTRVLHGTAAAYTFEPHPRRVLRPQQAPKLLSTLEQKLELFEEAGLDAAIVEPFDAGFAKLPAQKFVREILHARIGPVELYVGYDFRYGRDREGSMRTLTELGPHLGFSVTIIPEVKLGARDVNSTRIRELLQRGHVEEAAVLLERPYRVRGTVQSGAKRGRTLGFPTMNLAAENEILPAAGVYAGRVIFADEGAPPAGARFAAVINVGRRPTFAEDDAVQAEAFALDFQHDVYGRKVEFAFEHRLREERRFENADALKAQIARDAEAARAKLDN